MRSWRELGWGLLLAACSGGYPLPPTRCDEWCDATKGTSCFDSYDPAGCVSACEASGTAVDECGSEFDAVIACYRNNPAAVALRCSTSSQVPCAGEVYALALCSGGARPARPLE